MTERVALPESADEVSPLPDAFSEAVAAHAVVLGVELGERQLRALEVHARLLLAWNRHLNLTAIRDPIEVARLHVADSLAAVPLLRPRLGSGGRLLDLGSGGGYPGLSLATLLPFDQADLLDSVAKKVRFLDVACRAVGGVLGEGAPRVQAVRARAEELARTREGRAAWDVVTVRAVGSLAEIAELGLPLVRTGGLVVAWKRDADTEIDAARAIISAAGGGAPRVMPSAAELLPGHVLVQIEKRRDTPARYPRAPAQRRPGS